MASSSQVLRLVYFVSIVVVFCLFYSDWIFTHLKLRRKRKSEKNLCLSAAVLVGRSLPLGFGEIKIG